MTASGDNFLSAGRTDRVSASRVEWVPIEALRPNPKNARRHSKKQIAQIAQSIRQFGFLNPAIVDDANRILAGHGRFEAARLEGLTDVPILRFSHLTEAEKRAYAITDNRIAEQAAWDRQLLSVELGELSDLLPIEGLDISLTGFEIPEIDLLIAGRAKSRSAPEDVAPQPASPSGYTARRPVAAGRSPAAMRRPTKCRRSWPPDGRGACSRSLLRSARYPHWIGGPARGDRAPRIHGGFRRDVA